MPTLVVIAIVVAILMAAILTLTTINIVQNGKRGLNGKSVEDILGKPAKKAIPGDIFALSKRDVMRLFYAAEAPEFKSMKGEYKASLIPVGILAYANNFYAHHIMGPGHWEAKALDMLPKNWTGV